MAGLTKTYSGDLTQTIAGKLWDEIKDRLDEGKEGKPSKEVRKAARELKEDDPDATKVQDKSLRETVLKIFGPIDAKLVATERKVDNLSGKVSAVTANLVDTQTLIINQNQILEDKFDTILQVLTKTEDDRKKRDEDAKFKQLEIFEDLTEDLSKTGKILKSGAGKDGGSPLSRFLKGRMNEWTMGIANRVLKAAWKSKALQRPRVAYKIARRTVTKGISEALLGKLSASPVAKKGLKKLLTKGSGRLVPVLSSAMAADDLARYKKKGDWFGASLAAIDMAASAAEAGYVAGGAPGLVASTIATVAGMTLTGYEFFQILTGKDPYADYNSVLPFERGNVSPMLPDPTSSICEILSVTKAIMDSSGFGPEFGTLVSDAGLSSFPVSGVSVTSDIGRVGSSSNVESTTKMASDRKLELIEKEKETKCPDGMKWDQKANKCVPVDPDTKPEGIKRNLGGLIDFATFGLTDLDKRGDLIKKGEKTDEHDDRNIFQKTGDFLDPRNWFNKWGRGNKKGEGGPDTKPNAQRPIVGRVGNTGNSTGPHVHIQRFPPPTSYEEGHITKDHPVIDHIFVGGKPLGDWDFTSPASPDRWGRPHYGPDFGGLGINNQPITFSDKITFNPETLYQRSSGGEGNNILFEYNGEQFTIFHLNSGPEGDLAAPKRKDADLSFDKVSSPTSGNSLARSTVLSGKSQDLEVEKKKVLRYAGVVVINNIIANEETQQALPQRKASSMDFINAYNLAKHTV